MKQQLINKIRNLFPVFFVTAGVALCATGSHAATVTAFTDGIGEPVEDMSSGDEASVAATRLSVADFGDVKISLQTSGIVSANARTGELKADLFAQQGGDFPDFRPASTSRISNVGRATITENFAVTGEGRVSFLMDYDASWDAQSTGFFASVASIQDFSDPVFAQPVAPVNRNVNLIGTGLGQTVGSLSDNYLIEQGATYNFTVTWILQGSITTSDFLQTAFFDSSNTGVISVFASDGVTVTASDPLFLSDQGTPPDPNVVPLPAGMVLLMSGLAAIAALRRKRIRTVATAAG